MTALVSGGGAGEGVRREHARGLGAEVVVGFFRLVKLTQMHDLDNQATQRQIDDLARLVRDYGLQSGGEVNVLFARRAIFLAGQLLRASRADYEAATELGETLERLGGSELTVTRDVTAGELRAWAEAIAATQHRGVAFQSPTPKIRLRAVTDAARVRGLEVESLPPEQQVVRTYATAVVLLRRLFERLAAADYTVAPRLKRIAQSLVDLSSGSTMAFLRVTEARNANFDEAGRAVNTAILAVAVARELTEDRATLAHVAMAAMVLDAGRPRAGRGSGEPALSAVSAQLTEEQLAALPAGTAAVLTALGRLNEATMRRTVVAYEALSLRHAGGGDAVYGGLHDATLHARIVATCRRYNDRLTPEPGLSPPTPEQALAALFRESVAADRTVLRLLAAAVGVMPPGTVVRLTDGAFGEVVAAGAGKTVRVRVTMGADGGVLGAPREVDAALRPGGRGVAVDRVVSIDGWSKGVGTTLESLQAAPPPGVEPEPRVESVSDVRPVSPPPPPVRVVTPVPPPEDERTVLQASPLEAAAAEAEPVLPASDRRIPIRETNPVVEPTAKGRLGATPLVQILVYLLDHRLSGTLVLSEPDGVESTLTFAQGGPRKVSAGRPVARLGELLVGLGHVPQPAVSEAIVRCKRSGTLLGESLVAQGLLDRPTLERLLQRQVLDKIVALVAAPAETTFAFFRDVDTLALWPTPEAFPPHPLDAVLAATQAWPDRARVHATIARIASVPLEISVAAELEPVAFTDAEHALLARLRTSRPTLAELQADASLDREVVASLVYVLAVTRQLAYVSKRGLPMGRTSGESSVGSDTGSEGRISRVSFTPGESLAPPSSMPSQTPAPSSVRPSVRALTPPPPAVRVSSPPSRPVPPPPEAAPAPVASPAPPPATDSSEADADVKLADEALAAGDVKAAERLANKVALTHPKHRNARALVALLHGMSGKPQNVAEAIAELSSILEEDDGHLRSLVYRGRLRARSGKARDAIADLEKAALLSPDDRAITGELRAIRVSTMKDTLS